MMHPAHATNTVLRMALACWCVDPDHGMYTRLGAARADVLVPQASEASEL